MRVMANRKPFLKLRNWVQLGFLAVWLNPLIALPQVRVTKGKVRVSIERE